MTDYLQPDFYRFNQDSLKLVHWIVSRASQHESILDLGAGCGVVGLELAQLCKPRSLVLVEMQAAFEEYLESNIVNFLPPQTQVSLVIKSFGHWQSDLRFDVIACNPPYYLPGKGESASKRERQICRSFVHEGWSVLLSSIQKHIKPQGRGFVVIKKDAVILKEVEAALLQTNLKMLKEEKDNLYFLEFRLTE